MSALDDVYGDLLVVRAPVPATCNKAGANYKSEVTHLEYSPRRAYDEWLSILDGIVACGGDELALVPSLNAHPRWIEAVVAMARRHERTARAPARPALRVVD